MSLLRGYIQATTISFHDNDPENDTIADSGSGFLTAGFVDGDNITIIGSTSNNGTFDIDSIGLELYPLMLFVDADEIRLSSDGILTEEPAGDTVTITGTPWLFSPLSSGFDVPEERDRTILESLEGEKTMDEVSAKKRWELPVNAVSADKFDKISQWWQFGSKLRFNPDTSLSTVYDVRILNDSCPLSMMSPFWDTYYEGVLVLEEI
jgi:hypothetical protein